VLGIRELAQLRAAASGEEAIRAGPDDTAMLAFTSGTTGGPKGVPLTHRQLAVSIRSAMAAWRWTGDDVLAHALPLYHQHGLGGVHATLIAGSTAHLLSRFTVDGLTGVMSQARASVLFGVPTMYQALADALGPGAIRGLWLAVCGSAPLSPGLAARLPSVLGTLPLVRYGTTETGLDVSNPLDDPHADTVGLPLPGVLARIWAGDAETASGDDGEIQLRGPQVFGGVLEGPCGDHRGIHAGRLVPHRRHRLRGPRDRSPGHPGPEQRADHLWRHERLPTRGRAGA
jgi:acyl-CoA synthetase (AMP-forming)/AMP-acid ligase II